jgi:hypothetical protein
MKTSLPALLCFVMATAVATDCLAAARCALRPLAPKAGKVIVGAATVNLGDADDAAVPTAWQGPLKAGTCTFEIGIIEQPMALTPSRLMYVTTYSGSMRAVTLVDLNTCSVRWKSGPVAGKVVLTDSALTLGQKRLALDAQCLPTRRR